MATNASQNNISNSGINYGTALRILSYVFIIGGLVYALNAALLPEIEKAFSLEAWMLPVLKYSAFICYFVFALPSAWVIKKVGYAKGLVLALGVSALGLALFYPAVETHSGVFLVMANLLLGTGIAILQTAANPYVVVLGTPLHAAARLNKMQAFWSMSLVFLPVFLDSFLSGKTSEELLHIVQLPYLIMATLVVVFALVLALLKLPKVGGTTQEDDHDDADYVPHALSYIHVWLAVIGVFLYAGAESTLLFSMTDLLGTKGVNVLQGDSVLPYMVAFFAALTVGRFLGSTLQKKASSGHKVGMVFIWTMLGMLTIKLTFTGYASFWTVLQSHDFDGLVNWVLTDLTEPLAFATILIFSAIVFSFTGRKTATAITVFAFVNITLIAVALLLNVNMVSNGQVINLPAWALIGTGFFSGIMFPNIFTYGLKDLGRSTSQGAAVLMMALVGGFILPTLLPSLTSSLGVRYVLLVPLVAYAYLLYYGIDGYKVRQHSLSRDMSDAAIGIDIGANTTKIGIVDRKGRVLIQEELITIDYSTPEALVKGIHGKFENLLQKITQPVDIKGVGVGAPNGNYYKGTLDNPINLGFSGSIPIVELLRKHIQLPIVLNNDANAAALGEKEYGGAKAYSNFVSISLGNNLGSGLIINNALVFGKDGHAGELGHVNVQPDGRLCICGKRGCLQTYVSANGLVRTVQTILADTIEKSPLRAVQPDELTGEMIFEAAAKGDNIAIQAFAKTGEVLGRKLTDTIAHVNPEAIFLIGGLAKAGELIFEPTRKALESNLLSVYGKGIPLLESNLGESPGVLGAAALLWHEIDKAITVS